MKRWYRWIPLIAALVVTLAWLLSVPNIPVSDQTIYHRIALSLAKGQGVIDDSGHPTAYWAPGYSFYLSLFYYLFGPSLKVAFLANGLCYLALIAGVYIFARQLYSEPAACLAATLTAWYPSFIFYSTILASELFFSALLTGALVLSYACFSKPRYSWLSALASGILYGAAILVRPQAMVIPFLFFFMGWMHQRRFFWTMAHFCLVILAAFLTLLPWGLRNQQQLGHFVLVSANFGANLWIGNHPQATGKYTDLTAIMKQAKLEHISLTERDKALRNEALDFIKQNPETFIKLIFKRIYWTMRSESIAVVWNQSGIEKAFGRGGIFPLKIIANLAYYLLLLVFLWSLWKRKMADPDILLLLLIFFLSLPFLIFQGQDRFHLPLIPYMILFIAKREFA